MSSYLRYLGAALFVAVLASAPARADWMEWRWGDRYESPEENVILSERYDRLLETHPGFRHYRMWKECGPIDFSAALKDHCLSTFDEYEPVQYYEGWRGRHWDERWWDDR